MFVNFNILNQLGSPAINSNTFANRPAAGQTGRLFVSTDTYEIYRDNGTTWDLIGGPGSSTITGSGTATQVAYFTSSQAIGSSANLFWDNTNGFLGVGTATPTTRIEAVKTDGIGIYANFTTNAGSGSSTTALWAKNVTNSSGFAAVIEETTPNTTAGQYPLLIKHSLSSGTAGVGMGTGVHWQLPDDAGTFKTTQLTIETINAAAATYATRYRFNVQSNGSSTPVAYINATGVGIFTATPGAALDVHSTGTIAQFNTTSATGNTYIAFQRTGSGLWRIGDTYNGGNNFFELHNTVLGTDALEFEAATNKSAFQAQQTYTTGLARGNYFDFNLSVAAGGSFSSPNAITALTATLDLTLAGNATIPSGARSGLDAYNTIAFTGAGTLTHNQGTQIRAYSNVTAGWAFNGSAVGTITHLAGLRALFPDNSGSAVNVTNNYALLLNDQTANTGTVTYTNRWGVYQEGTSDLNYMAANLLLGSTTNSGEKLQVTGTAKITGSATFNSDLTADQVSVNAGANKRYGTFNALTNGFCYYDYRFNGALYGYVGQSSSIVSGGSSTDMAITSVNNLVFGSNSNFERLRITSAGLVGIGTNAPTARLQVSNSTSDGVIVTTTTNTEPYYALQRNSANSGVGVLRLINGGNLYFDNGATGAAQSTKMVLTATGRLGIGTINPAYALVVEITSGPYNSLFRNSSTSTSEYNAILISQGATGSATGYLGTGGSAVSNAAFANNFVIGTQSNSAFVFNTNDSEKARFTAGGNFLIGTTTDAGAKLQVSGLSFFTDAADEKIRIRGGTNQNLIRFDGAGGGNAFAVLSYVSGFLLYNYTTVTDALLISNTTNNATFGAAIKTAAPNTGTAANWKLGSRVAATVVVNTNEYIEIDIGGTLYKLATVT